MIDLKILKDMKAVIFDLDGTLVDSMWIWRNIDIEFLGKRGHTLHESLQKEIEGMSFHETAVYFKEYFHLSESLDEIKDIWNSMAEEKYRTQIPLKKGVAAFVKYLREQKIKMGIATSNSRYLVEECLKALNIQEYFDYVVTACEVSKGKPAPDIYLNAAQKLGVPAKNCLVFEDVPMGIMAGKSAGMKTCAVKDLYSENMIEEKKKLADYYIEDYDALMEGRYEVCNG